MRLRGRWVVADPSLLDRLRRRPVECASPTRSRPRSAGTLTVDGDEVDASWSKGALATLADRLRGLETAPRAPRARRARRDAPPVPAARAGLAGRDAPRPRRLPRRRHGPRQDDPAHRPPPAPARDRTRRVGGPRWWSARPRCSATGSARSHGSRPASRCAATTAATHLDDVAADEVVLTTYGIVRRDAAALAARRVGSRGRRRGPARQEPAVAHRPGAARDPGGGAGRAHRHPGREPPHRALGDPRLDDARPARPARDVPPHDRGPGRTRRATRRDRAPRPAGPAVPAAPAQVRPRRSRRSCRRRPRPTSSSRSPPSRSRSTRRSSRETIAAIERGRGHRPPRAGAQAAHRAQADLQPPGAVPRPARAARRPVRQARRVRRAARRHRRRRRLGARLHPVRRDGPAARAHLASRGIATRVPARRHAAAARRTMVDGFQAGDVPVFLLSLKAGGTGLNLTRATHVVHYDRWWNPAVEDQATDRAYRIGQDRPVQVHRLVTEGTIEDRDRRAARHEARARRAVLGAGEAWITELSDDELTDARRRSTHVRRSTREAAASFGDDLVGSGVGRRARATGRASTPTVCPRAAPTHGEHRVGELTVGPGEVGRAGPGPPGRALRGARAGARRSPTPSGTQCSTRSRREAAHAAALLDGELQPEVARRRRRGRRRPAARGGRARRRVLVPRLGRSVQARGRGLLPGRRRARPRSVRAVPPPGPRPRRGARCLACATCERERWSAAPRHHAERRTGSVRGRSRTRASAQHRR